MALRCSAPRSVAERRLRTRAGSISDADPTIAAAMATSEDPWPEAHDLPTDRPTEDAVAHAAELVASGRDSAEGR